MKNNQPSNSLKLTIFSLIAVVLFIADLYFMINQPGNIIALVIITVLLLLAFYVALNEVLKNSQEKNRQMNEQYEQSLKSDKASYLLLRKTYDDLSDMIKNMGAADGSSEEVIKTQKAAAKLIIERSRENADALMNSNDHLVEKMLEMEEAVNRACQEMVEKQDAFSKSFNDEVMLQQDKLFIELNNAEASISDHLTQMNEKLSGFQEEVERLADHLAVIDSSIKEGVAAPVFQKPEASILEEPELSIPDIQFTEEPGLSEPDIQFTEEPGLSEPDFLFTEEPEPEITEEEPEISVDSMIDEALSGLSDDSLDVFPDDLTLETDAEETSASDMPDLSDPGKMMTPEEIEALIAGTLSDEPKVDEPIVTEEPAEEEKPPMPDLSDPNKVMTPDEIAALLANM